MKSRHRTVVAAIKFDKLSFKCIFSVRQVSTVSDVPRLCRLDKDRRRSSSAEVRAVGTNDLGAIERISIESAK